MQVLVTGCAGFIGSHVSKMLRGLGHAVAGVANMNDAYDRKIKERRLRSLLGLPGFAFKKGDITNRAQVDSLILEHRATAVINLAARAGVRQSTLDPEGYYKTNLLGVLTLLDACRASGVKRFIQASSSSVYGDSRPPFKEDQPTERPLSPYAASKKASEELCYTYHRLYGIDVMVLRFFTVYGPAGRPDMSVFRFIKWVAEGEPVTLYGDGAQKRDFTYVEDVARGVCAALSLGPGFQIVNLGSDRPLSLSELIGLIEHDLGKKAVIDQQPFQPADVSITWADISRARELLRWAPQVSIEEGIAASVRWYRDNRHWAKDLAL